MTLRSTLMRAVTLCLLLVVGAACRTPSLTFFGAADEDVCASVPEDKDGTALACDEAGGLVACTGRRALTRQGGLRVCTEVAEAGFMYVCTKSPGDRARFTVELLPCAACASKGEGLGVVDFGLEACSLPTPVLEGPVLQPPLAPGSPEGASNPDGAEEGKTDESAPLDDADAGAELPAADAEDLDAGPPLTGGEDAGTGGFGQAFSVCPCAPGLRCDPDLGVCVVDDECDAETAAACRENEMCIIENGEAFCVALDDED